MRELLWRTTSTNGRWGVEIVGDAEHKALFEDRSRAIPGQLRALGRRAGFECFAFEPGGSGFLVIEGEAEAVEGAGSVLVHQEGLQSNSYVTLLHVAPLGLWKWTGYKGRDAGYRMVRADGSIQSVPTALLLDAGIVQPKEPPPPASAPPVFGSSFADALRKAGLT